MNAAESHTPSGGETPTRRHRVQITSRIIGVLGLPIALLLAVAGFGLARPSTFLTASNLQQVLNESAAPAIIAAGLTVPLVLGSFDLSIGAMVGLGGASAVALMSMHHVSWEMAILIALAIAVAAGLTNGFIVVRLHASAFITTLATGTILLGIEYLFTGQATIYSGISPTYLKLGHTVTLFGINDEVWIALAITVILVVLLERTELGRRMYAIGSNRQASYLAGVRVQGLETVGFVVAAVAAAIAGILITAQGGASTPNAGAPYLLPAYAAAFLGTAAFRQGRFNVAGAVLGAIFLETIAAGLTMLNISTAVINIVQGAILIIAVLLTGFGRGLPKQGVWERSL
jgi:ribose transport system permease protein